MDGARLGRRGVGDEGGGAADPAPCPAQPSPDAMDELAGLGAAPQAAADGQGRADGAQAPLRHPQRHRHGRRRRGPNSRIRTTKSRCCGFRSIGSFLDAVHFHFGGLGLFQGA